VLASLDAVEIRIQYVECNSRTDTRTGGPLKKSDGSERSDATLKL
jgi:hypothetical protein